MNLIDLFNNLSVLADDQDAFDKEKDNLIDEFLSNFSPEKQDRLKRQLWRISMDLRKYKNHQARCNKALEIMWEEFTRLNSHLKQFNSEDKNE